MLHTYIQSSGNWNVGRYSPGKRKNKILSTVSTYLHSLYRSPNIVRVIKSKRFRWGGHLARMEEGRSAFKVLTDKPTGKRPLRGLGVNGRTILEWTLKR